MKKATGIAAGILVMIVLGTWARTSLNEARRPAREVRALALAYALIQATNSTMLVGAGPEFRTDLANVLAWPTWRDIDRSPPRDTWAVVRLIITNDHGQALHMRLRDEFPSERLRLLSYRRITGPAGSVRDKSGVGGGWPRSLTFTFGARAEVELNEGFFTADRRRWTQIFFRVFSVVCGITL